MEITKVQNKITVVLNDITKSKNGIIFAKTKKSIAQIKRIATLKATVK